MQSKVNILLTKVLESKTEERLGNEEQTMLSFGMELNDTRTTSIGKHKQVSYQLTEVSLTARSDYNKEKFKKLVMILRCSYFLYHGNNIPIVNI